MRHALRGGPSSRTICVEYSEAHEIDTVYGHPGGHRHCLLGTTFLKPERSIIGGRRTCVVARSIGAQIPLVMEIRINDQSEQPLPPPTLPEDLRILLMGFQDQRIR